MNIQFYKYQGTGNDFVIMDNRNGNYSGLTEQQVAFLCHRRFGVGADGLMLLNTHPRYDFEMIYFNADGRPSSMCGNGGRCLVRFASDRGITKEQYRFLAVDGEHDAICREDGTVSLKMQDVAEVRRTGARHVLNTGSPHLVQVTTGVGELDVFGKGREIRYSEEFREKGINVNFLEQLDRPNAIRVRTYERGVEDETLSCGTGVTAAAIVSAYTEGANAVEVETPGGKLRVEYEKQGDRYSNIWLIGPAVFVYEGWIQVP